MSRELDERVARALEWTHVDVDDKQWKNWHMPQYSTDYACVPEMLAWLRSKGSVQIDVGIWRDAEVSASFCSRSNPDTDDCAAGATLPEALARLVVAVAEAKEAGK